MSCSRLGQCGFSSQIVKLLTAKKIEFKSFNILEDEEVRQGLKVYSDWPTYPQLYAGGTLIGGLDVVKELIESGELENELKLATLETNANSVESSEKITASSIKNKIAGSMITTFLEVDPVSHFWFAFLIQFAG